MCGNLRRMKTQNDRQQLTSLTVMGVLEKHAEAHTLTHNANNKNKAEHRNHQKITKTDVDDGGKRNQPRHENDDWNKGKKREKKMKENTEIEDYFRAKCNRDTDETSQKTRW